MSKFATSGLSVSAFCQRIRVSEASFYRWRALLGAPDSASDTDSVLGARVRGNYPGFVDLGSLSKSAVIGTASGGGAADAQRISVRVELGAGVVLQISRG